MRFRGKVYRAHNPEWWFDPLSGEGARLHGGRFNAKGLAALYVSLDVLTAIREASPLGQPFHPLTLCQYDVDCADILDTNDLAALKRLRISRADLDCPDWRLQMLGGAEPASQRLAQRLIAEGFAGLLVRSYAKGAEGDNLVFWKWGPSPPHKVTLVDPEGRLPKDRSSWAKTPPGRQRRPSRRKAARR